MGRGGGDTVEEDGKVVASVAEMFAWAFGSIMVSFCYG